MKKNFVCGEYFNGQKISDYGIENGYVDFGTFCKNLNMVLNNEIMGTLENLGYWFENENLPDNSDKIDELNEEKDFLNDNYDRCYYSVSDWFYNGSLEYLLNLAEKFNMLDEWEKCKTEEEKEDFRDNLMNMTEERISEIEEEINSYEDYEISDIFQYFIVDDNSAQMFKDYTDYPVYYCEKVDMYIVGITHWGTSWSYVLTDIKCNVGYDFLNK